jgi:molybdopterin converting factor subunit 1
MRVTIRLFARLRDIAGAGDLSREAPAGATVGDVWLGLVAEFPEMARYQSSVSSAVNADYARMTVAIADGDEIAFLPPVSGGSDFQILSIAHVG